MTTYGPEIFEQLPPEPGDLFKLDGVSQRIEEAIRFARQVADEHDGITVSHSGGKDSVVLAWIIQAAGIQNFELVYCNTGNEHRAVIDFVRSIGNVTMLRAPGSWYTQLLKKGLPTARRRWCCWERKERWLHKHADGRFQFLGTRAAESNRRAKQKRVELHTRSGGILVRPIHHLKNGDIWYLIERERLPICKLYELPGVSRLGCMVCPMRGRNTHKHAKTLWPKPYAVFERYARQVYDRHSWDKVPNITCFEEMLTWYYGGNEPQDSPNQLRLFSMEDAPE